MDIQNMTEAAANEVLDFWSAAPGAKQLLVWQFVPRDCTAEEQSEKLVLHCVLAIRQWWGHFRHSPSGDWGIGGIIKT